MFHKIQSTILECQVKLSRLSLNCKSQFQKTVKIVINLGGHHPPHNLKLLYLSIMTSIKLALFQLIAASLPQNREAQMTKFHIFEILFLKAASIKHVENLVQSAALDC